jgi:hypothetical protein
MNRRTFVLDAGAVACAGLLPFVGAPMAAASTAPVTGQTAPGTVLADPDLPALDISVNATSINGVPETLNAGRYLLNVTAAAELEFGGGVEFAQPTDISTDEFISILASSADGPLPESIWNVAYAGGVFAKAGQVAHGIVDLGPGTWVVYPGGGNPQHPFTIEVTGELPTGLAELETSATLTMSEYSIEVTEGELTRGTQWVRVDNVGAQPHFIVANFTEMPVTMDDVAALLEAEMTGTPAAVGIDPETDLADAFYTGLQSINTSQWVEFDLVAGTYVLLCFWPDLADGMPHAMHGMYQVVTISA